ncbi:MAG: hypothetical protein WCV50_05650 [Patescibacteria group bacterium]|jgi:hypothetical protein
MNVQQLIQQITPLYNNYKRRKNNISGTAALEIMWDIGDLLKTRIDTDSIAPHTLYRNIYGKSEGKDNITQKSYITREFLSRSYRIRKYFSNKDQIQQQLPSLKKFIFFREAMPFFDNKKYKLSGDEGKKLINLLNSNLTDKQILSSIKVLQKQKINIRNPRSQKLHELENEKVIFINFYNYIYSFFKHKDYRAAQQQLDNNRIMPNYIKDLARNTSSMSQDGLKNYNLQIPLMIGVIWQQFSEMVNNLNKDSDPKKRRRFRRLISPERIVRLADMLFALTSENNYKNFK